MRIREKHRRTKQVTSIRRVRVKKREKTADEIKCAQLDRETNIREKRIGIIFKVIYVIGIFFAAMFTILADSFSNGITDTYIMISCSASFLLCLLIYMLVYIFNELKCLKISQDSIPDKQRLKTETSYSFIFTYFIAGGIVAIACAICLGCFHHLLSKEVLSYIILACVFPTIMIGNLQYTKAARIGTCLSSTLWTIMVICLFTAIAMN